MAFDRENLTIVTNNVKSGVVPAKYWFYNESDDTVTTAGYFTDLRLHVGDIIEVLKADYTSISVYRVSAVTTAGAATAVILTSILPA